MDANFASLISFYRYAEDTLTIERNYYRDRKSDPFMTTDERLEAMTAMVQLDVKLVELKAKKEDLVAAHDGGTFPAPSNATLAKVHVAAEKLSKALSRAANANAVVLAAADFFEVLGKVSKILDSAPAPEGG